MVQRRNEGMELSRNIHAGDVDGSYTERANVDSVSAASLRRREVQKGRRCRRSVDCRKHRGVDDDDGAGRPCCRSKC